MNAHAIGQQQKQQHNTANVTLTGESFNALALPRPDRMDIQTLTVGTFSPSCPFRHFDITFAIPAEKLSIPLTQTKFHDVGHTLVDVLNNFSISIIYILHRLKNSFKQHLLAIKNIIYDNTKDKSALA